MNVVQMSSPVRNSKAVCSDDNASLWAPKVNGKHNKHVHYVGSKAEGELSSQENSFAKMIHANVPMYKEVLPGLESWQASKIATWHNLEGHSIQWFSVVCIDRRGIMADVTTALATVGVTICSCVAEIDRGRGIAVMLFHVEGNLESLVNACSSVDLILGVLGWSTGCSWPSSKGDWQFHEC